MTAIAPARLTADDFTDIARAVTFVPEPHGYAVGMTVLPSATQILRSVGVSVDFERLVEEGKLSREELDLARDIGKAVHRATHYYDEGTLQRDSVDPRAEAGLQAWIDWRALTGFVPVLLETALWHPGLFVAGTPDRAGYFTKFEGWDPRDLAIIDLKRGSPDDAGAQWQTSFYAEFLALSLARTSPWYPAGGAESFRLRPRYSVQLPDSGKAKLERYDDGLSDWRDCQHFVTTFRRQACRRKKL